MKELSIIVLAYNKEKTIEKTLRDYSKVFPSSKLIVLADGCKDNTVKIVRAIRDKNIFY